MRVEDGGGRVTHAKAGGITTTVVVDIARQSGPLPRGD